MGVDERLRLLAAQGLRDSGLSTSVAVIVLDAGRITGRWSARLFVWPSSPHDEPVSHPPGAAQANLGSTVSQASGQANML